jgi:hypothetical protein
MISRPRLQFRPIVHELQTSSIHAQETTGVRKVTNDNIPSIITSSFAVHSSDLKVVPRPFDRCNSFLLELPRGKKKGNRNRNRNSGMQVPVGIDSQSPGSQNLPQTFRKKKGKRKPSRIPNPSINQPSATLGSVLNQSLVE